MEDQEGREGQGTRAVTKLVGENLKAAKEGGTPDQVERMEKAADKTVAAFSKIDARHKGPEVRVAVKDAIGGIEEMLKNRP